MYSALILFAHQGTWKTVVPTPESGFQPIPQSDMDQMNIGTVHEHILQVSKYEECSKFLGLEYVQEQLPKNNIFIVIYNQHKPIGYIMASFMLNNGIYLDVICSTERKGSLLLNLFIQICKETFKASYIQLSSLMHVLTYYPKLGFSHRKSCAEPPSVGMSPELSNYIMEKMRSGELNSDEAFFDDPKIANFIHELHKQGYTKTQDPPSCQNPSLGIGLQKQRRCGKDGYKMIKCLVESAAPPASYTVPFTNYVRTIAPRSTKPPRELQSLMANFIPLPSRRKTFKKSTGIASRSLRGSRGISRTVKSIKKLK